MFLQNVHVPELPIDFMNIENIITFVNEHMSKYAKFWIAKTIKTLMKNVIFGVF